MRRQGLPTSGLQSNKGFAALLLAGNTPACCVAPECEPGDAVLSQGTSETSAVPYSYGQLLCAVAFQAPRCTDLLYSFLIFFLGE